jgi:glucose-6-phosphate dehydrogenase assembly protein OpcA
MSESKPPTQERGPAGDTDLLWDCFTNWSELLRKMETGKARGG